MKKIILTTAISTALIASSVYAAGPAASGLVFSGEGSYSMIAKQLDMQNGAIKSSASTGFGLGGYVGYDYAITNHVTIGAKTGYFHSFGLGKLSVGAQPESKATSNNIPLLLNAKYYFNSGLYLGGETGINFQKVSYTNPRPTAPKHNWNAQYVIGGLVGYQINENISIDGSIDYMTGDDLLKDDGNNYSSPTISNSNKALANIKFGLAVNYKLPM